MTAIWKARGGSRLFDVKFANILRIYSHPLGRLETNNDFYDYYQNLNRIG